MKAAALHEYGGPEVIRVEEVSDPEPGPGEALVRVRACGVNRLDIWIRTGRRGGVSMPHILGSEVAGDVAALGPGAASPAVGQRVAVAPWLFDGVCEYCLIGEESLCVNGDILGVQHQGGYAEYVAVPAMNCIPVPEGVSYDAAAAVTLSTITAWHMLVRRAQLQPGETLLVLAAGSGVGSAAVQIGKLLGARVLATAGSDWKLQRARGLGADALINYTTHDLREEALRLTGGRGADVVLEHVGQATWEQSVGALAANGRLVTCGVTTGNQGGIDIRRLYARQLSLLGSMGGTRGELHDVLQLVARGGLQPVIDRTYPLDGVPDAHRRMEEREQFGKLIVKP